MKVTVIHGIGHKKNTYNITYMLLQQLNCKKEDIKEFFISQFPQCCGCTQCILKSEELCPHYNVLKPIKDAIDSADVIIIDSPNYCMNMSGQLKSFFDHMAFRWMSHRPYDMRNKIGVAVSTTAGSGASKTTKLIAEQLIWWSCGRVYKLPITISALSFDEIPDKSMAKIKKKIASAARKVNKISGKVKPCLKTSFYFKLMTLIHKGMSWNENETVYWKNKGWI